MCIDDAIIANEGSKRGQMQKYLTGSDKKRRSKAVGNA